MALLHWKVTASRSVICACILMLDFDVFNRTNRIFRRFSESHEKPGEHVPSASLSSLNHGFLLALTLA
jgi:hypothetical protein